MTVNHKPVVSQAAPRWPIDFAENKLMPDGSSPAAPPVNPEAHPVTSVLSIWEFGKVDGWFRLPFAGCGSRYYHFNTADADVLANNARIFLRLREHGIPERWCDLAGKPVHDAKVQDLAQPHVMLGPLFAGAIEGLPTSALYVVVTKAELSSAGPGHHARGDAVYRWAHFPSRADAERGVVDAVSNGYGVAACWIEVEEDQRHKVVGPQLLNASAVAGVAGVADNGF